MRFLSPEPACSASGPVAAPIAETVEPYATLRPCDIVFLRSMLVGFGLSVERLPYTAEFESMCRAFSAYTSLPCDPAALYATLTKLRKAGEFKRVDYCFDDYFKTSSGE